MLEFLSGIPVRIYSMIRPPQLRLIATALLLFLVPQLQSGPLLSAAVASGQMGALELPAPPTPAKSCSSRSLLLDFESSRDGEPVRKVPIWRLPESPAFFFASGMIYLVLTSAVSVIQLFVERALDLDRATRQGRLAIFLPWRPHTTADLTGRFAAIDAVARETSFVAYDEATIDELYYLAQEHANREVGPGKEAYNVKVGGMGTPLTGDESRKSWPSTYKVRDKRH